MGAWGTGSFENDAAHDWLVDFSDMPHISTVKDALSVVAATKPADYVETDECGAAIAAAEIIAALKGSPNPDMPDDFMQDVFLPWAENAAFAPSLTDLALRALARLRYNAEMEDGWLHKKTRQAWHTALQDLEARLKSPLP